MKTLAFILTLFLAVVCDGLAQTNIIVLAVDSTPTNLAHLIASADYIVITNESNPQRRGFGLSITGDRVQKIVTAVSTSTRNQIETASEWDWEMQFFRATNRLVVINFQGRMFLAEKGEYADNSGMLDKLYSDVLDRTTPPGYR